METAGDRIAGTALTAPVATICGFWRRLGAFAIDYVAINIVASAVVTTLLHHSSLSLTARSLFLIAFGFVYFSACWGDRKDGQTIGMRALRVRVVALSGEAISLRRAALRTAVLCAMLAPMELAKLPDVSPSHLGVFLYALATTCAVAMGYLAIFNRRNGRLLHDLAAGTAVVLVRSEGPVAGRGIAGAHRVFLPAVCLLAAVFTIVGLKANTELMELWTSARSVPGAVPMGATIKFIAGPSGTMRVGQLTLEIRSADPEAVARSAAKAAAKRMGTNDVGAIAVTMQDRATDLYIVGSCHVINACATPDAWLMDEPVKLIGSTQYRLLWFSAIYLDDRSDLQPPGSRQF